MTNRAAPLPPSERHLLLLWGAMGTGKSTVGALVAKIAQAEFSDLDALIAAEANMSISSVFQDFGEARFRALERAALERVLDAAPSARLCPSSDSRGTRDRAARHVVALGGGALLDPELRARALREGFVVVLEADAATLAERVRSGDRPLLASDSSAARIGRLLVERAPFYAEGHAHVPTVGVSVADVADRVRRLWGAP